jgi:hypothetical protein
MEDKFTCDRCGFHTNYKRTILTHLSTPHPCRVKDGLQDIDRQTIIDRINPPRDEAGCHKCEWCDKLISKSNFSKHKKVCKKKPDDDTQTLQAQIDNLKNEVIEMRRAQQQSQPASVTNNDHSININNYIQLNNFGSENLEHITQDFIKRCLMNNVSGMKALIEKIHFSEDAPHNKNIKIKSQKDRLVYVNNNNRWVVQDAHEATGTMIRNGCNLANHCYLDDNSGMRQLDEETLDHKIQSFLLELLGRQGNNYHALHRRIVALIIEYTV